MIEKRRARDVKQEKKLMRRPLLHEEISQYIKEAILTGEL